MDGKCEWNGIAGTDSHGDLKRECVSDCDGVSERFSRCDGERNSASHGYAECDCFRCECIRVYNCNKHCNTIGIPHHHGNRHAVADVKQGCNAFRHFHGIEHRVNIRKYVVVGNGHAFRNS
jgi:hypothetical protein